MSALLTLVLFGADLKATASEISPGSRFVIGSVELTVPEVDTEAPPLQEQATETNETKLRGRGRTREKRETPARSELLTLSGEMLRQTVADRDVLALSTSAPNNTTLSEDFNQPASDHPISLGLEAGVFSVFSASAAWRISEHFGIRVGLNRFAYDTSDALDDVSYSIKLKLQSEPVLLDFHPWPQRSFRLSLGILLNQNRISAAATSNTDVEVGNSTYSGSDLGTLNLSIKQRAVCPYVGIGGNLFYFDSDHRWAMTQEIGVAWTGKPKVSLSATGTGVSSADLEQERRNLSEDLSKVTFLPMAKLGISFSF